MQQAQVQPQTILKVPDELVAKMLSAKVEDDKILGIEKKMEVNLQTNSHTQINKL